jgi:hypothetical protein
MAQWLQAEFKFDGMPSRVRVDPPCDVADRKVEQPACWSAV